MTTVRVSPQQALVTAVDLAMLAPSVHNTQPWRFSLHGDVLSIRADASRALAILDPWRRQQYLSIGCALFNARVSIAEGGLGVAVERLPQAADPTLVAGLRLDPTIDVDEAIAALDDSIQKRQSNRRQFDVEPVPQALLDTLVAAATAESARLTPIIRPDDRQTLARLMQHADALQIANPAYRAELRAWTTTDPARLDGVRAAVVPHVDGTSGDEVPLRDFDTSGTGWLPSGTHSSSQQCLLVLETDGDVPMDWVRGGEALERVWLEITRAGYVASIFSQVIEVGATRVELRDELRLSGYPQLVLRVGRAPLTAASQRRRLIDLLDDAPTP